MYIGSGHFFIEGKFLAILKRMCFCQVEMETLLVRVQQTAVKFLIDYAGFANGG